MRHSRNSVTLRRCFIYYVLTVIAAAAASAAFAVQQFHHALIVELPLEQADVIAEGIAARTAAVAGFFCVLLAVPGFFFFRSLSLTFAEYHSFVSRCKQGDSSEKLPGYQLDEAARFAHALNDLIALFSRQIESLQQERIRLDVIFTSMAEGVVLLNSENRIVSINPAAERILRTTAETSLSLNINSIIDSADLRQLLRSSQRRRERVEGEIRLPGSENRVFEARVAPSAASKGELTGSLIVMHEVTELRQFEKMRRDFVANVSHELKTPVTSIKGFVETLLGGSATDEERNKFLHIILGQADRLGSIIEDLLTLARLESNHVEDLLVMREESVAEITAAVLDVCRPEATAKQIELLEEVAPGLTINADRSLLQQALMNLVENGVRYSPSGTIVRLTAEPDASGILIKVIDQGPGIEEHHHAHVFERFYRVDKARSRKLGGTGLGLAVVKQITGLHGGSVAVHSRLGAGSTFIMRLPGKAARKA